METGLKLLTREGVVQVLFRPRLTAEQYAELAVIINNPDSKRAMCDAIEEWAKKHELQVMCDDAI